MLGVLPLEAVPKRVDDAGAVVVEPDFAPNKVLVSGLLAGVLDC